jgi:hypothetical protein
MLTRIAGGVLVAAFVLLAAGNPTQAQCVGDCDGDGVVTVAEIILAVGIAIAARQPEACPGQVCSEGDCVPIALIVRAVGNALRGCQVTPSASATVTPMVPTAPPPPTPTTNPDSLAGALESVLASDCHPTSGVPAFANVRVVENGYIVKCQAHVGAHETIVDLVRYPDAEAAASAFAAASEQGEAIAFRDLPAVYWETPFQGGRNRYLIWQVACWVVSVHNFDDTHFQTSPQPLPFSEAILEAAGEILLSRCS